MPRGSCSASMSTIIAPSVSMRATAFARSARTRSASAIRSTTIASGASICEPGSMNEVEVIRARALQGISHGFLGRRGGVSTGVVAGLNVGSGSGDDPAAIFRNRGLAIAAIRPGAELATVHQCHSADAVTVVRAWPMDERPSADAMATDRPGVLLGIVTADCAPVLFADLDAGVIGAAHAGWRGALAGVTDSAIAAMERLGARRDRIHAAVGPCIAQPSYEVDETFRERFLADDPDNARSEEHTS